MSTIEKLAKDHRRKLTVSFGRKFEDGTQERKYIVKDEVANVAGLGSSIEKASLVLLDILERRGEL